MTTLRDEIANQFHECMGHWEGIYVPDHEEGHRAINYADQVLKLIEKRIDDLVFWYKQKAIIEIEPKVVFEDIKEVLLK